MQQEKLGSGLECFDALVMNNHLFILGIELWGRALIFDSLLCLVRIIVNTY